MIDRVTEYAKKVVEEKENYGSLHVLACERHLNDLKKQGSSEFPYYWNPEKSEEILEYAETLTIAEGSEPKPVKLIPSQIFDIGCTFGWMKTSNDKRRFRRRYKSMGRQNGKTFENGIIGTYIAAFDGYNYGKLFTAATKKRQSRLAWEEMSKFVTIDPDLSELFTVKDYKSMIVCDTTGCTIEALSKEAGLDDGFRSIFCSVDEIHQHTSNKIYKALYNGQRSLPQALISMITTRGDNLNSFCKEFDDYAIKVLKGITEANDLFVDIYCLDENDDIWNEKNWIKANPFICLDEERMNTFRSDAQTARDMGGSELRDFLTKCLNMWVQNTDDQFVNTDKWKECGSSRTLKDFEGKECWVGLDLSSGGDLTTLSLEFEENNENSEKYYFYSHSFMPRGRLMEHIETDLAPYDVWESQELLTVTGGLNDFKNDYKFIISHLKKLQEKYNLKFKGIGIDPHNADGVLSDLEEFGCPVVLVTQSCKSLNDATCEIQLLVKSNNIEYNRSNELLTWSFCNAAIVRNSFDEIKVDKKPGQRFKRVDAVDACVDAHAVLLKFKKKELISADDEMSKYLEYMNWQ